MQKTSLHIGLNYGSAISAGIGKLEGCVADALNYQAFFTEKGYKAEILVDMPQRQNATLQKTKIKLACFPCLSGVESYVNETVSLLDLTKRGIMNKIESFITSATGPIVITYSGHGTYEKDTTGDEADGKDEGIVPLDCNISGIIRDDDLLFLFLKSKHPIVCIFDSCYSGTVMDLPYTYDPVHNKVLPSKDAGDLPVQILCISACRDTQEASDTANIQGITGPTGALTACFLGVAKQYGLTPRLLSKKIQEHLTKNGFDQVCNVSFSQQQMLDKILEF